jgi:hypothetical protein
MLCSAHGVAMVIVCTPLQPQYLYIILSTICLTDAVIAHTRFATSSINKVSELHPHEWSPFKEEVYWRFNPIIGKYERSSAVMGVHITHNGDFDELEAYQQVGVLF